MPTPYANLSIPPRTVAHVLNMPAVIYDAFQYTMCAGEQGSDPLCDYHNAIECLANFIKDVKDDIVHKPVPKVTNTHFINDVKVVYLDYTQARINLAGNHHNELMLKNSYLAGDGILNLYSYDHAHAVMLHLIDDAIANLNAAIFYASRIDRSAVKRWTDTDMLAFFAQGVLSQKRAVFKAGMSQHALVTYKAARHE